MIPDIYQRSAGSYIHGAAGGEAQNTDVNGMIPGIGTAVYLPEDRAAIGDMLSP
ncbi:MAG: hypothetical protein KDD01_03875 [Phaeodactylibacter sp.]|nr:hypothetical protein [Phaeodactylibacter sp.]